MVDLMEAVAKGEISVIDMGKTEQPIANVSANLSTATQVAN
jgi:hypothetical protein